MSYPADMLAVYHSPVHFYSLAHIRRIAKKQNDGTKAKS